MKLQDFLAQYYPKDALPAIEAYIDRSEQNNLGYRLEGHRTEVLDPKAPPSKSEMHGMFLGCSWTWGAGVTYEESFPTLICDDLSRTYGVHVRNWNLSMGGCGIDYVTRTLMCCVDLIKPDFVYIVIPAADRREYYRADGRKLRFCHAHGIMLEQGRLGAAAGIMKVDEDPVRHLYELTSHYGDLSNTLVNLHHAASILDQRKIPWGFSIVPSDTTIEICKALLAESWIDPSRYLGEHFTTCDQASETDMHPGPRSHRRFASKITSWLCNRFDPNFRYAAQQKMGLTEQVATLFGQ